jgi:hypothetical protein
VSKDPSPKADQLRAMREAKFSTAVVEADKADRLEALRKAAEAKLRPFAGKISKGEVRAGPRTDAQKAQATAKKRRNRANKRKGSDA